ncbi:meiotic nuclear division 1-like protein [Micractinium conductrix]|uniref:Meiotic nuclear division protein 1 homolog n=1 Tax=Micractinium conductrix TaxID=554055 RepID=A0A2P6VM86_9CHLO|nr:meiotic nuclear division 1-like protein [Micractinium conductrix]|eukprot:PSC75165.1 meiotic nuclear division 1-like protein [Micractinium conductrix]
MSLEEKRQTLLGIFHETKEVFQLKEVEKLASKRGVVLQSVKEVLQGLVDDDLVHSEKIGISNYFWYFPSEQAVKLDGQIQQLETRLRDKQAESASLQKQLELSKVGKEDSEERRALMQKMQQLQAAVAAQEEELAKYAGADPERYDNLKKTAQLACDSANRWIDNIEALRGWLKKKFEGMDDQIDALFKETGVKEDAEYLQLEALP